MAGISVSVEGRKGANALLFFARSYTESHRAVLGPQTELITYSMDPACTVIVSCPSSSRRRAQPVSSLPTSSQSTITSPPALPPNAPSRTLATPLVRGPTAGTFSSSQMRGIPLCPFLIRQCLYLSILLTGTSSHRSILSPVFFPPSHASPYIPVLMTAIHAASFSAPTIPTRASAWQ